VTYRPDIDGLRAVAVLSVVAYHADAALVPGGFVGVDVFFVISGFLITSLLVQSLGDGSFTFSAFYARRLRRLVPSLVVMLAAAAVAGWAWLFSAELVQLGAHIASSAVFVTNFVLWGEAGYFDRAAEDKPLLHLWSLGVEEQFYLVWPLLLWLTWRRAQPLAILGSVAVLSFAANIATIHWSPAAAFYWPTSRFWELAIGGVVACLPPRMRPVTHAARLREAWAWTGALLLAAGFLLLDGDAAFPGWWALLPVAGTAGVIAAGPDAWLNRAVLSRRTVVVVGLISYPLYLWHWPLLTFGRMLAGGRLPASATVALVGAAFLLAWLSYALLERPLRHRPSRWVVPSLASALVCAGACGLALRADGGAMSRPLPADVQALADFSYRPESVYRERVCYLLPDQPPSAFAPECTETAPPDRPLVLLWGASHAAHLTPGLKQLQSQTPFRLAQFTGTRCPPLLDIDTPTQPHCQDVNRMVLEALPRLRPHTVLLAARWRLYPLDTLERTVKAIRQATDARIVVVGPVPHWDARLPRVLVTYATQHPHQPIPTRLEFGLVSYTWDFERTVRDAVTRTGAQYASAIDAMCTRRGGCLTQVPEGAEHLTAWDEAHLTASGSIHLVSQLRSAILPAQ